MKPSLIHRKDVSGLEAPIKTPEVALVINNNKKPEFQLKTERNDHFASSACCRLLIFWSLITTLSSIVSIYYAIDAQNRLSEAQLVQNLNILEERTGFKEHRYV